MTSRKSGSVSWQDARARMGNPLVGRVMAFSWVGYMAIFSWLDGAIPDWPIFVIPLALIILAQARLIRVFPSVSSYFSNLWTVNRLWIWYTLLPDSSASARERGLLVATTVAFIALLAGMVKAGAFA